MNDEPDSLLELVKAHQEKPVAGAMPPKADTEQIEPENIEEYKAFHFVAKRNAPEQFELRSKVGNSRFVEYHTLLGAEFHASLGILVTCVTQRILIQGKRLRPLARHLQNHQIQWVQEFNPEQGGKTGEESVVSSITVYSVGRDRVMGLEESVVTEIQEFGEQITE